jgi:hypothetical protein
MSGAAARPSIVETALGTPIEQILASAGGIVGRNASAAYWRFLRHLGVRGRCRPRPVQPSGPRTAPRPAGGWRGDRPPRRCLRTGRDGSAPRLVRGRRGRAVRSLPVRLGRPGGGRSVARAAPRQQFDRRPTPSLGRSDGRARRVAAIPMGPSTSCAAPWGSSPTTWHAMIGVGRAWARQGRPPCTSRPRTRCGGDDGGPGPTRRSRRLFSGTACGPTSSPEWIRLDDWEFSIIDARPIPADHLAHARWAVDNCPGAALRLRTGDGAGPAKSIGRKASACAEEYRRRRWECAGDLARLGTQRTLGNVEGP